MTTKPKTETKPAKPKGPNDPSRRTVTITYGAIKRLQNIGGTIERGIELASFASDVTGLLIAKTKADKPAPEVETKPALVRGPKRADPVDNMNSMDINVIMRRHRNLALGYGYDPEWYDRTSPNQKRMCTIRRRQATNIPITSEDVTFIAEFARMVAIGREGPIPEVGTRDDEAVGAVVIEDEEHANYTDPEPVPMGMEVATPEPRMINVPDYGLMDINDIPEETWLTLTEEQQSFILRQAL